jgi:hypothetical protein
VLVRAPAVSGVGQMPVPVTVGGVALLAESRVVVKASRVHLPETVRSPERLEDGLRAVGADRIADPAVTAGDTCEHQVPLRRIAVLLEGLAVLAAPAPPAGRKLAGGTTSTRAGDLTAGRAQRFRQDPDSHAADYRRPRRRARRAPFGSPSGALLGGANPRLPAPATARKRRALQQARSAQDQGNLLLPFRPSIIGSLPWLACFALSATPGKIAGQAAAGQHPSSPGGLPPRRP